ncbi:hypothetical protein GWO43_28180 [candidate division KSB1 bacterium]|nr:hypothetical protein [candidate division KSB1 bacterium]NIR71349.1 hypothetical protein [candidate division KSB1 bacterium]NIS26239.1 hypothetical protein [candidate division KSB1 bacterium]NIT74669.1 hypothetical protein [candidate division KSB1 bacterium]NIU26887.1 hypothetical protein [candidate division KSB1 bacterium]
MAEERPRGSIIYELLIVILAAVLVASIVYPKKLRNQEQKNTQVCRERMGTIFNAELQYLKYKDQYTDTLDKVIDFIRNDTTYSTYIDTLIKEGIDSVVTKLNEFEAIEQQIVANIPQAVDTVMIDSLGKTQQEIKMQSRRLAGLVEFIHDKTKNLPNMPVAQLKEAFLTVDSKKFTLDMDILINAIEDGRLRDAEVAGRQIIKTISSVRDRFLTVLERIPEYKEAGLDSLRNCPTIYEPYKLVHVDTAVIKYLNIYCPIDSSDVQTVESNFLKSTVGGLNIQNHGKIEKGEKSWETGT